MRFEERIDGLFCIVCKTEIDTAHTTLKLYRGRPCHLFCHAKTFSNQMLDEYEEG